jgi:1-acyl-sn-glycerol-3-phosphate acyltransferase
VVYVNHPSWWDPLIGLAVSNLCYPGIQFCAPIDAIQLQRYAVFKKLGLFPVEQGTTRGALSFLHQSKTIFKHHPKAMLWMTPQGCFTDARQRPVFLQDGLAHLARRHREVRFQPLAVEYTFWNNRLPEVLLRFGTPVTARELPPVAAGTESHGLMLAFALQKAQDDLAGESILRQPESFRTLLAGRSGMGGFYQVWKQLQSRLTGRPYQADHNHSLPS